MVIGLGTQDDLDLARTFVENTGVSAFPMLWDESFDSWVQLGVATQPAWALFSPDGEYVEGGLGAIDTADVLARAASL